MKDAYDVAQDAFLDHVEKCWQCREHPFHLCPEGEQLMEKFGDELFGENNLNNSEIMLSE